jgi:hypothetical protein
MTRSLPSRVREEEDAPRSSARIRSVLPWDHAKPTPSKEPLTPAAGSRRIDAGLLIPGRGEPIKHATLIFEGKKIMYAGASKDLPPIYAALDAIESVPYLMPGMWGE